MGILKSAATFSISAGSFRSSLTFIFSPHLGQMSGSTSKTFLIRAAQAIETCRLASSGSSAITIPSALCVPCKLFEKNKEKFLTI